MYIKVINDKVYLVSKNEVIKEVKTLKDIKKYIKLGH